MQKVLIIGATSAIAEATARLFAQRGNRLHLLARNQERLESLAQDLVIRGAESVTFDTLDINDIGRHQSILDTAIDKMDGIDIVLIAHGTLPDQEACEHSIEQTLRELNTNAVSVIALLSHLANLFEKQGNGTIAVISSVAGDRGRQSNYVYGAAKGAITLFLQGLRNRLHKSGVHILTIKPGFVDTPMTAAFKKGLLWAKPDTIARGIMNSINKKKDVVYLPSFWRLIMLIIRIIPESIFKKTNI
jgi:decaprenylphospho-beta-D-erythro-pentofuranosid-2-ulose 2-reductase